jgi:hypothetical protein
MAFHKEILDILNSKLPIIHPGEVANRVLDALQGLNPFNILRHSFWILLGSLFFSSLCSACSKSCADLECPRSSAQSEAPSCPLKYKKGGDVGSHEPQSDKIAAFQQGRKSAGAPCLYHSGKEC